MKKQAIYDLLDRLTVLNVADIRAHYSNDGRDNICVVVRIQIGKRKDLGGRCSKTKAHLELYIVTYDDADERLGKEDVDLFRAAMAKQPNFIPVIAVGEVDGGTAVCYRLIDPMP